ncbi:hypothetical protein TPR58_05780 [Sphingomonas sp. HF-S3]|uniref:Uncharacterized protein n=1 Tax=Sphingomonas rustica TaxID=3103142 RepID=A0ABV0B6Q1_9SPHN
MKNDDNIIPNGDELFAQPAVMASDDEVANKPPGGTDSQGRRSDGKGTGGKDAQMRRSM